MSIFIIAEIGINHNGDLAIAKKLIDVAAIAGADAVKFQKRTVGVVYTKEELDRPREHPWGTTNRELKERLEFGKADYDEIDRYCKSKNLLWSASAWDVQSQEFLRQYDLKFNKVASAMLTNMPLLEKIAEEGRRTFISTGMSTYEEVDAAVALFRKKNCPFELMHTVSTYPCPDEEVNLLVIPKLRERYGCKVGYSGHEGGIAISYAAAALGAASLERHITLNRAMFGTDQAASVEPTGFMQLCGAVRKIQVALGDGVKKMSPAELAVRKKLRGV
jgi:N-acetylneuraminate synthase